MSKYDKYIEDGRKILEDYASEWKSLLEEIKFKENDRETLKQRIFSTKVVINLLEQKLDILHSAKKVKRKAMIRNILIYGLFELLCFALFSIAESLDMIVLVTIVVLFFGKLSYNVDVSSIKRMKKVYNEEKLTEERDSMNLNLSRAKDDLNTVSSEIDKLYEEKEELRNIICDLNNTLRELEKERTVTMEQNLVPNIDALLDESFEEIYGENNPFDVGGRVRKNPNM